MKMLVLVSALVAASSAPVSAQDGPPQWPVAHHCDDPHPYLPRLVAQVARAPVRHNAAPRDGQPTWISLTRANSSIQYFVGNDPVSLEVLGERTTAAWQSANPDAAPSDCWDYSAPPPAHFILGARQASICRIAVRIEASIAYGEVLRALTEMHRQGFTQVILTTSEPNAPIIFTEGIPLNPVFITFDGTHATFVQVTESPTHTLVLSVGSNNPTSVSLAQLGGVVSRQASENNPALEAGDVFRKAEICVRPDRSASFGSVLTVLNQLQQDGFYKFHLNPEAPAQASGQ